MALSIVDRLGAFRRLWPYLLAALVFRAGCYAAMTAVALWNELRPAPTLPDLVISAVPYIAWVDRLNYLAWLFLYVPLSAVLLWTEPARWVRYMFTGGLVSLARGMCIGLTGFGVPDPVHLRSMVPGHDLGEVYVDLLSPFGIFGRNSMRAYLTKDLFFSGHTATTFLLVLYLWHRPRLRLLALAAHVIVVASVLAAHLHYSLDVVGAWAFTFALYALREWEPRSPERADPVA